MKKISMISIFAVSVMILCPKIAFSYPVTTNSPLEAASQVSTEVAEKASLKERIKQTTDKINENAMFGVVGMLKGIVTGDKSEILKNAKQTGYEVYKAEKEKKDKAKQKAQEEAKKQAAEKLEAKQEGEEAAEEAVGENRKKTKENLIAKGKRAFNWAKKKADTAMTWTDEQTKAAGSWIDENRGGLNKMVNGAFGDSQSSTYAGKAFDALSNQAKKNKNNKGENGADNSGKNEGNK